MTVQLVSKISNLCDPDPPTLQTDRQTDRETDGRTDGRHAISIPRYALVHRAVKIKRKANCERSNKGHYIRYIDSELAKVYVELNSCLTT